MKDKAPSFIKKVRETITHYDMLRGGEKVLAAVSGGQDSVCMLKALLDLRKRLKIELVVANMDHGIRGDESVSDSRFVGRLAAGAGLEFVHKKVNIKNEEKNKRSIEEVARERRYSFLCEAARKSGCSVIATGHTLDDQAETVLMRVISGTSTAGLGGIPPVRYEGDLRIIRPLIRTEKREAGCYLRGAGWEFVEDSTNSKLVYLRNKVRIEIMPFLEKYNPKLKRALANLSDGVRDEFAEERARRSVAAVAAISLGKDNVVPISDMVLQPKMVRKEIFKELLIRSGGNIKKLTYRHWMDLDRILRSGSAGNAIDLPGDIRATRTRDEIIFAKRPRSL